MKSIFYFFLFSLVLVFLSSCTPAYQIKYSLNCSEIEKVNMANMLYHESLSHENDGVVESTMMCVGKLKMRHQSHDCSQVRNRLNELTSNGKTERIRYKALLTTMILDNPSYFCDDVVKIYSFDDQEFYNMVSAKVNRELLGLK